MSNVSKDSTKGKRDFGVLNTTIDKNVLTEFRSNCKMTGIPMSVILESFMRQYNKGGFYLKFGRSTRELEVQLDEKEYD